MWMCQDKQKFESLVKYLSHLVASLRMLLPLSAGPATPLVAVEALVDMADVKKLRLLNRQTQGSYSTPHQACQLPVGFSATKYVREHTDIVWQASNTHCCISQWSLSRPPIEFGLYVPQRLGMLIASTNRALHSPYASTVILLLCEVLTPHGVDET